MSDNESGWEKLSPERRAELERRVERSLKNRHVRFGPIVIYRFRIGRAWKFNKQGKMIPYKHLFWNVYWRGL